jgi:hypothetical protein
MCTWCDREVGSSAQRGVLPSKKTYGQRPSTVSSAAGSETVNSSHHAQIFAVCMLSARQYLAYRATLVSDRFLLEDYS